MATDRIQAFQKAFRNLQLQPLITAEEITKFQVPYGHDLIG